MMKLRQEKVALAVADNATTWSACNSFSHHSHSSESHYLERLWRLFLKEKGAAEDAREATMASFSFFTGVGA